MPFTASEIARQIQGQVLGDATALLTGFARADQAQPGDLTFAENDAYFQRAEASPASAILVAGAHASEKTLIRVTNVRAAWAKVVELFYPEPELPPGIHATAVVAATASVDATAHIGPHCVVGENARIGARSVLRGGNHVDRDCRVGEDCALFPGVTLYARTTLGNRVRIHAGSVIGADGFGYVFDAGRHLKIPQVGNVVIGDDVEIGANVTIDRGALGPTTIGRGTKIDNLVQVAHNVSIGEHCLLVAQVGVAGSTTLGNYVVIGGQVGIAGHLKIGNQVTIAAQSGVMHDVGDGEKVFGSPAIPDRQAKRQIIAVQQLPDFIRELRREKRKPVEPDPS